MGFFFVIFYLHSISQLGQTSLGFILDRDQIVQDTNDKD
jgi:hypothetical protein